MSPYHTREIPRGVFGDASKILEEIEEFTDALEQENPVLQLCELADVIGAIEGFVVYKFNITLDDLIKMKNLNKKAFENGYR